MVRRIKSTPFQSESLPRSARELVVFFAAAAIVVDFVFLAVSLTADGNGGSGQLGDVWKAGKMLILIVMLVVLAVAIRAPGMGVAAVLLALFFMEESELVGYRLGTGLAEILDLAALETVIPAPPESWGKFLVLGALSLVTALTLTLSGERHSPLVRRASSVLTLLVLLLFAFAGVSNLFADAFPQLAFGTVADFETHLILTLMIAYTGGLLRVAPQWSQT